MDGNGRFRCGIGVIAQSIRLSIALCCRLQYNTGIVSLPPVSAIGFHERPTCELCGATDYESLLKRDFLDPAVWEFIERYYVGRVPREAIAGAVYEVLHCKKCGFYWQRYVLNDAGLITLYEHWIDPDQSLRKRTESSVSLFAGYAREMLIVNKFFPQKKPGELRVLDYGMGWGHWVLMAKACGFQAYGLELSEGRIAYATERGVSVLTEEELAGRTFDFINSEQCFEHITHPRKTLDRLVSLLAPNGVVRIAVPDAARAVGRLTQPGWKAKKDPFHPLEHISGYTHASLIGLCRDAGLKLVHRPVFPVVALTPSALLHSMMGSLYYRFRGTALYFCRSA